MPDYNYDLTADFVVNNACASEKMTVEIEGSSIAPTLDSIDVNYGNGDVKIKFDTSLSAGEETTLDGLVAAHDGVPYAVVTAGYAESASESNTNSTSYLQKLRYSAANLQAGDYILEWYFESSGSDGNAYYDFRVQCNDTDTLMEVTMAYQKAQSDGVYYPLAGFKKLTLAAGDHDFDIDYQNNHGGQTTYIRNARLRLVAS